MSNNKDIDLTHEYSDSLKINGLIDSEENRNYWLSRRNKQDDEILRSDIMKSPFSFTRTFGEYHPNTSSINLEDSYESSYIVYCHDREGNALDFNELFDFAVSMCKKYDQDSVYVQEPGQDPYYVNGKGKKIKSQSLLNFQVNNDDKEHSTTQNGKENNPHKFTADFQFEGLRVYVGPSCFNEGRRRRWYGEVFV